MGCAPSASQDEPSSPRLVHVRSATYRSKSRTIETRLHLPDPALHAAPAWAPAPLSRGDDERLAHASRPADLAAYADADDARSSASGAGRPAAEPTPAAIAARVAKARADAYFHHGITPDPDQFVMQGPGSDAAAGAATATATSASVTAAETLRAWLDDVVDGNSATPAALPRGSEVASTMMGEFPLRFMLSPSVSAGCTPRAVILLLGTSPSSGSDLLGGSGGGGDGGGEAQSPPLFEGSRSPISGPWYAGVVHGRGYAPVADRFTAPARSPAVSPSGSPHDAGPLKPLGALRYPTPSHPHGRRASPPQDMSGRLARAGGASSSPTLTARSVARLQTRLAGGGASSPASPDADADPPRDG